MHTYVTHGNNTNEKKIRKEGQYDVKRPDQGNLKSEMMSFIFYSVMDSGTFMAYNREQIMFLKITFLRATKGIHHIPTLPSPLPTL